VFTLCWSILYYFVWMNAVLNQFACYCLAFFQHSLLVCCYLLSTISTFYIKKYWSHIVQCSSLSLEPTYQLLSSTPSCHSPSLSPRSPYVIFVIFILSLVIRDSFTCTLGSRLVPQILSTIDCFGTGTPPELFWTMH